MRLIPAPLDYGLRCDLLSLRSDRLAEVAEVLPVGGDQVAAPAEAPGLHHPDESGILHGGRPGPVRVRVDVDGRATCVERYRRRERRRIEPGQETSVERVDRRLQT